MESQDPRDRGFSTGRVFGRAFATIAANPGAALGIAFLFGALPLIGYHYLEHSWSDTTILVANRPSPMPPDFWFGVLYLLGLVLLNAVIGTVGQGAFAPLVVSCEAREPLSLAEVAALGLGALPPLLLLGLLIAIGTTAASMFLLIPGIILGLRWAVAGPVLVIEHCGVDAALGRSRVLTEGARVRILAIAVVVAVVVIGLNLLIDRLAGDYRGTADGLFGTGMSAGYLLTKVIGDTVATAFAASIYGALYVELLNWKDSAPTDALREIFA